MEDVEGDLGAVAFVQMLMLSRDKLDALDLPYLRLYFIDIRCSS